MGNLDDVLVRAALTELDVHLGSDRIGGKAGLAVEGDDAHGYTFRVAGDDGAYFVRPDGSAAVRVRKLPDGNHETVEWRYGDRSKAQRAPDWPKAGIESKTSQVE